MSAPSRIHPENQETIAAFFKILNEPLDKPITEMNEETSRDIQVIWASINALASGWRGNRDMHVPKYPVNRKEYWGVFAQEKGRTTLPALENFIQETDGKNKVAIDLGCGNSPAVPLLLKKGWRVLAVDNAPTALEILIRENRAAYETGELKVIEEDATTFLPNEPVDLVIAADVLPYIDPAKFQATWVKIHDKFIKSGGVFIGSLFRLIPSDRQDLKDLINVTKENGGWLLPDRRMVRPLLTQVGYNIQTCVYRNDLPGKEQMCIQFVAKKG